MEAFIEATEAFFIDWGYAGLFLSAFVAGSILPFSSEIVMAALIGIGLDPTLCVLAGAAGNTAGGMTCYWIGHLGKTEWIERYLGVERSKLDRATAFLGGRGAMMGFFAFLPYIGEAIAIALGLMKSDARITAAAMFAGKALRYAVIAAAVSGIASAVN